MVLPCYTISRVLQAISGGRGWVCSDVWYRIELIELAAAAAATEADVTMT